ncbi:hypothetical protein OBA41_01940, partial [Pelagibacteraceae bacterium]|nr:hypothetical protein [Pelagibacteraceae bacterium]
MNLKKFLIFNLFMFLVIFSKQLYAYQQDIVLKYNNIFSSKVLSDEDVYNYQQAYNFQEKCKWKSANNFILKINNKSLLGHIYAQKFLHPNCYRSKYLELYYWLKKYNDHPQAKQIYKLAIRRMPTGYKSPSKPTTPIGIEAEQVNSKKSSTYKSTKKLSSNQRVEKRKLINAIKSRVNKGWPTGAVQLLNQRDVDLLLDQVEIDEQKELIAKGYFLANKNDLAIQYASEALVNSAKYVPYAAWTAGLSSWRLEKFEDAAKYFSLFSISLKDDAWHQTSGSFWTARSYAKLGRYDDINFWLK